MLDKVLLRENLKNTGGIQVAMAPSKILGSCCSRPLFFYHFSVSEYQIGIPCSYVYLVQFLPFISLGSPLEVFLQANLSHTRNMMLLTLSSLWVSQFFLFFRVVYIST